MMSNGRFQNTTCDMNSLWFKSHKTLIEKITKELGSEDRTKELVDKFLNNKKMKKYRDENAPKKPRSAFLFFCDDYRSQVMSENPDFRLGDMSKELAKLWKTYSSEDKEQYYNKYNEAKELYVKNMEEYKVSLST